MPAFSVASSQSTSSDLGARRRRFIYCQRATPRAAGPIARIASAEAYLTETVVVSNKRVVDGLNVVDGSQCTRLDPGAALRPQTRHSFDCLDAASPSRSHS